MQPSWKRGKEIVCRSLLERETPESYEGHLGIETDSQNPETSVFSRTPNKLERCGPYPSSLLSRP